MKMKAAQISKPGAAWELIERDVAEPGPRQVRVKTEACGICLLLVPAAPAEPLTVSVMPLIAGRRSVAGWYIGHGEGFARYVGIQRTERRPPDDREVSTEPGDRRLRADA